MKLIKDTVGSIVFTLRIGSYDGDIIEKVTEEEPFDFVFGKESMLDSFEAKLKGLTIGDEFKFFLTKDEAYGNYMQEMQVEMDKEFILEQFDETIDPEEELVLDNYLPMLDPEGNTLSGKITFIDDKIIKMDFNHPLADMDLYFEGKLINLRPANAQEIMDGEVFQPTEFKDAGPDDPPVCTF